MLDVNLPQLPDEIPLSPDEGDDQQAESIPEARPEFLRRGFRTLRHGAYFLQWLPSTPGRVRYNGTMRVHRHRQGVTASGDLYHHPAFRIIPGPPFRIVPNPDPSPNAGIPIFARSAYRCYLRVTQILEGLTIADRFTLGFELYRYDATTHTWSNQGAHTAEMVFTPAPSNYPSGALYLEGALTSASGTNLGTLRMGWVSRYLRKSIIEIDRVNVSEYPADNGAGVGWQSVFDAVDWDVNVYESDTNLSERSGESWSDAEMHAEMLARRDAADLDAEWRYHIICVRRLDSTTRGIMYDAFAGDSNNIPREGASISSHWVIPTEPPWGTVAGMRFGAAVQPYFRTAVHEIGHAFGLYHNTADNGFMNATNVIAASGGVFPANILWSFHPEDARRLRHMPDPWVRPGMIPFGQPYGSTPISPNDMVDLAGPLVLDVKPVLDSAPLGAPVRIMLTLTNTSDAAIEVPASLTLKDEHVTGTVRDPSQNVRSFRSVVRCIEERQMQLLEPKASMDGDMTLLRGREGALFPTAGVHDIEVQLVWEIDAVDVHVAGSTTVMVTAPADASHALAAKQTLTEPDLLLTLAIGGDHLREGKAALAAAMNDDMLAPHYAVVAAKQAGRRFGKREANPEQALSMLGSDPVMTPSEARKAAAIIAEADDVRLKEADASLGRALEAAAGDDDTVRNVTQVMGT